MIQIDYPKSLHKLRRTLNVSQQQLANILNVSFSSVNRWENGHYEPTIIAKVKLDELFDQVKIEPIAKQD